MPEHFVEPPLKGLEIVDFSLSIWVLLGDPQLFFGNPLPQKRWPIPDSRPFVGLAKTAKTRSTALRWGLGLALLPEERLHQVHAARRQNSRGDFHLVIELGMVEHLQHGVNRACLRIFSAIDQPPDAGVRDGSGTHRTGFDGHVEIAVE